MGFVKPLTQSAGQIYLSDMPNVVDVKSQYMRYGIKAILSLDAEAGKIIRAEAKKYGIVQYIMQIDPSYPTPGARAVFNWIKMNKQRNIYPLLIHCKAGKDRTGFAAAAWLISKLNYTPKQAIDLMTGSYGYGTGGISADSKNQMDLILYEGKAPDQKTTLAPNQPTPGQSASADTSNANDIDVVGESQKQEGAIPESSTLTSWAPFSDSHESYPTVERVARIKILRRVLKFAIPKVSDEELEEIFESTKSSERPTSMEGNEEVPKTKTNNMPENLNLGNVGQRNNYQATPDTFLNAPSGSPGAPNGGAPMEPGGLVQL